MTSTTRVVYADEAVGPYTLHRMPVKTRGPMGSLPGQGADGYGKKISTSIGLRFNGEKQLYRVYCVCFSNSGSNYIIRKGETLYLKTHFQDEIQD